MAAWSNAWLLAREATDAHGTAVADLAIAESLLLKASLGQTVAVQTTLAELKGRPFTGAAAAKVAQARELAAMSAAHPEDVVSSGVQALRAILAQQERQPSAQIAAYRATAAGASLVALRDLATTAGLPLRIVVRDTARQVPVPSVVHWTVGHYSAVVQREGERYRIVDDGFAGTYWVSRDTLLDEASGYFLVPADTAREGWSPVADAVAATIVGHSCPPGGPPPSAPDPNVPCTPCRGMVAYHFHKVSASLHLSDTPVGYAPARGPAVHFRLTYRQRGDGSQPQIFSYGNVGAKWTSDWLRFLDEVPLDIYGTTPPRVELYLPGGGREVFYYPDANGVYPRHWRVKATLVKVSESPVRYERRLPDGTVEVFATSDAAPAGRRRVFLSAIIDPAGEAVSLTWDAQLRLVALTDALGQVTAVTYSDAAHPLRITAVTDPFQRTAAFAYNAAGQLASITDVIGLTSRLAYGPEDFVAALTTPYGRTSFRKESDDTYVNRMVEATDGLGGTERVEFRWQTDALPVTLPAAEVPTGFTAANANLDRSSTFYWDTLAWARAPGDAAAATITKWTTRSELPAGAAYSSGVPHSIQRPLESRVWYLYPGQTNPSAAGTYAQPSRAGRILDDGMSQIVQATYNAQGSVLTKTDPLGRQTSYAYAANGIDLLTVRQTTGGMTDLLATYADYTAQHRPQTTTDAAGQTTTVTYNAAGQPLTVTNAKGETTTSVYDTDGRLQSVTGPVTGATTTYTYDGYGRVRTITDADGYTVTTDYDVFDRPIRTTYPDGTYEETTYDRLDVNTRRDRAGRITRYYSDALRRLTATRDPAGRVIAQDWCACGSLNALIDANGNRTRWERDLRGRVTRELRADGVTATTYTYGPASGRLLTMTDPKQQVTTYTYTLDDAIASTVWTTAQIATPTVSYTYDTSYGRVATMLDGIGTTSYTYHPPGQPGAGQVASVDGPLTDDTITYTYDELGRVTTRAINGAANTVTWSFDPLGRVTTEQNLLGTFAYTYDGPTGRVATVAYPNGQTSAYSYFDNANDHRLQTIHHKYPSGTTLSKFDYTYDAVGNIVTWRQQADTDAVLWAYGYDLADQLMAAQKKNTDPTPTILKRYAYAYDPAGNRTVEQIDDQVTGATHDNLNRLVSQQPAGAVVVAGTVSEPAAITVQGKPVVVTPGNTFTTPVPIVPGTNTVTVAATDPSGNTATRQYEVDSIGSGRTFTFDANGNLTSDGTRTFEWDARNQLVAITAGTHRSEFGYDGQQRRGRVVEKENGITQLDFGAVWCDEQLCEERITGGTLAARRFTQGELLATVARFLSTDHLGSVRDVSNSTTLLLSRSGYDPWGRPETQPVDGADVRFTGHQWESLGRGWLTKYRFLDVATGRWSSADPLGLGDGPNLYVYARNNPIKYIDATGETAGAATVGWFVGQVLQCAFTMGDQVNTFHRPNEQNNRYAHCLASCLIKNVCPGGGTTAIAAGFGKEIIDVARCAAGRQASCDSMMEKQDFIDNQRGRDCPKNTSCLAWCSDLKNQPDRR